MRRCYAALAALLVAPAALAQPCAPPTATAELANAGVRATLFTDGSLFGRRGQGRYEVPAGSGREALRHAALWVAGRAAGDAADVRFSGVRDITGGQSEFRPGPLGPGGAPPADCSAFDRIWRVTLADIAAYNHTGVATADLAEWPHRLGAPVVDGDGDPSSYSLAGGDRPALLGDETAWWVMNDRAGYAPERPGSSGTAPVWLEVRVTAFTVSGPYAEQRLGLDAEVAAALHHATAYRFDLAYRGDVPLEEAGVGLYVDPDIGGASDDAFGTEAPLAMAYGYNRDAVDEGGYGPRPPAVGISLAEAPGGELTAMYPLFLSLDGGPSPEGLGLSAFGYMLARWDDDTPVTRGGDGYNPGSQDHTRTMFDGRPPAFWSAVNTDGSGRAWQVPDARFVIAVQGGRWEPGDRARLTIAVPFAEPLGGASGPAHVTAVNRLLLQAAPVVRAVARTIAPDPELATITPEALPTSGPPPPPAEPEPELHRAVVAPNPMGAAGAIRLELPEPSALRVTVVDVLGRVVAELDGGERSGAASVALPALAPGLYVARIEAVSVSGRRATTRRFTVAR